MATPRSRNAIATAMSTPMFARGTPAGMDRGDIGVGG